MEAPILLIVFNRPETTAKVFEAIRRAKPRKLYISADGLRKDNLADQENCKLTRDIVSLVDWDCDVKYRFLDENLGCGLAPASAISWAFENEDRLIILEDDCIPTMPFFDFCNHCLNKYLEDERIWVVSGRSHHENSKFFNEQDYIFSHYGHTWGWATWKRCWIHFDIEMKKLDNFISQGGFMNTFLSNEEGRYYNKFYKDLAKDKQLASHIWDYQHVLGIHINGGLSITPSKNLIENIGIVGTHTEKEQDCHRLQATNEYFFEKEPLFVLPNREYDLFHFKAHINPYIPLWVKVYDKLSSYFKA
jgi:hypothetical protein